MRYGKEKTEFWIDVLGITLHFFRVPPLGRLVYTYGRRTFTEFVAFDPEFTWTTFFGIVVLGRGFAVSNFEQKKQQRINDFTGRSKKNQAA